MGKALLVAAGIVLLIFSLFDIRATPDAAVRYLPKPIWFVVCFIPYIGPLLWLFLGNGGSAAGGSSRHGPDDDPDYLRGL